MDGDCKQSGAVRQNKREICTCNFGAQSCNLGVLGSIPGQGVTHFSNLPKLYFQVKSVERKFPTLLIDL